MLSLVSIHSIIDTPTTNLQIDLDNIQKWVTCKQAYDKWQMTTAMIFNYGNITQPPNTLNLNGQTLNLLIMLNF